jgi:hypothetical protein
VAGVSVGAEVAGAAGSAGCCVGAVGWDEPEHETMVNKQTNATIRESKRFIQEFLLKFIILSLEAD